MKTNIVDLKTFRERKKNIEKLIKVEFDLDLMLNFLDIFKESLKDFTHYVPIRSIYTSIQTNEKLLKKHYKNITKQLENYEKEEI